MEVTGPDETIRRVCSYPGVMGVIICSRDGVIIRSTMDSTSTQQYVTGMQPLEERCATAVREVDPTNELQYIRLTSKRFEVILKTEKCYLLYVIQTSTNN